MNVITKSSPQTTMPTSAGAALATEPQVIPLWPGTPPGTPASWTEPEREMGKPNDRRIGNVTMPTISVYAPRSGGTGVGVIVCPGSGFRILAFGPEGEEVAPWLNSLGMTAFVLKYRVMPTVAGMPATEQAECEKTAAALGVADALQAMHLVRARAAEWGVALDRIGIMGFSAGGYLAAAAAACSDSAIRPNFAVSLYGMVPDDIAPAAGAPPMFVAAADDDARVPCSDSVRLYCAWKRAGISAELHIYAHGGHGFALGRKGSPEEHWTDLLRVWLSAQGLLEVPRHSRNEMGFPNRTNL